MYLVNAQSFLKDKTAVIFEDLSLKPFGYPALIFEVESENKAFYRMVGSSSKNVLYLDGKLEMIVVVPTSRELDWENELKRLSISQPFVVGNSIAYTILLDVTVTPISPSHSQIAEK